MLHHEYRGTDLLLSNGGFLHKTNLRRPDKGEKVQESNVGCHND